MALFKIEKIHVARGLILKLHGRCNLACDYCYMYESMDQSWRTKPKAMSRKVIDQLAVRIAEYMREHQIPRMNIILHGGEPLLAGKEMVEYVVTTLRSAIPADRTLRFSIQTNGVLLDESWLELCLKHDIQVSVSLDGPALASNRHRLFPHGGSSYDKVRQALELFQQERFRHLLGVILGVIDLQNDPAETYDELAKYCRNTEATMDFLMPLGNWDNPPPGTNIGEAAYAHWLVTAQNRATETNGPLIRLLEQMLVLAGVALEGSVYRGPGKEVIGPFTVGDLVIESDGTYEGLDAGKTVAAGEPETGLNVFEHRMTQALVALLNFYDAKGIPDVAPKCQTCKMFPVCGGGYYPNRSWAGSYRNPSVYCQDLYALSESVYTEARRILAAEST